MGTLCNITPMSLLQCCLTSSFSGSCQVTTLELSNVSWCIDTEATQQIKFTKTKQVKSKGAWLTS